MFTIGKVVSELSGEFPDLTVSKVRYLEERGLLRPLRTPGGQRRYSTADVERLRQILRLQRDDYLPLDVIAAQATGVPNVDDPGDLLGSVASSRLRRSRTREMTSSEVCQRAGAEPALLAELQRHGLIERLDLDAVDIVRTASVLSGYGIEPRHLRTFRTAADRDVTLVEQALAPRPVARGPEGATRRREQVAELLALLLDLHVALVRARSTNLGA